MELFRWRKRCISGERACIDLHGQVRGHHDHAPNDLDCYLCVVDTDGIGVEAAVAGGQLNAAKIKDMFDSAGFDVKEKTDHGAIILPGLAARLQGDVEDTTGLTVMIGPPDSGQIPRWMESKWES
jgi:acetyl-CoA decarbonylase/synthase complex subunit gamma